jgi:large subunit ribosomal protein L10Ae
MSVCVLGDQHDIDRAKHLGTDAMSADDLKKLNKNKKLIKSSWFTTLNFELC